MTTPQDFIYKLSDHLQKNNALQKIINKFQTDYSLTPCIGVEIEFYLSKNIAPLELQTLLGIVVKKEKGDNQFEIDLPPSTNIIEYIGKISSTKSKIQIIAKKLQGKVNFSAKPFPNDYGSSMHFHVNFIDSSTLLREDTLVAAKQTLPNVIARSCSDRGNPEKLNLDCFVGSRRLAMTSYNTNVIARSRSGRGNPYSLDIIGQSICHYMLDSFLVFMPNEDDYLRLDKNFMAPTNVSFGNNNRTVAVRIPDSFPRRLEHRIASPLTDPYLAIFTILNSILLGLEFPDKINNISKIYGNAFDQQYNLVPLPKSLAEALELFNLQFFYLNIFFKNSIKN
ncbi:type I glutamate--ammonia ligase [Rickettsia endosymbiont of Culicoides newsteadi]|uniref:glutamine synthetase n=1 Tax=Rickettsia endosymbiont of Culicoides newsteadi TaxID=1961830 RepID=UPI000BD951E9|nr:glutamine synthetase [Rickettsia endosymbiont of Culicoides newsteadi]OZG31428.1 glutamine synthetase [Rickettsia endosymbiont of Culicoides newsteadi]